jgi:hypothetical protein
MIGLNSYHHLIIKICQILGILYPLYFLFMKFNIFQVIIFLHKKEY